ncbi:MAG: menaquinone biosynthesis protein [Candidatus Tectomicrobia bacterium]|uniref:Chorismate dehydratase n=1 Tax=Tectimicrobiota bacterium TaxID=2528274 RepID=A0A933GMH2_UNCTE|nr:menaquinone biosynthesis protein [Candidatus Tectomicrobia bacterium]
MLRLGPIGFLNTKPIIYGLEKNLIPNDFELIYDVPSVCADKLKNKSIDLALIPSIEYARSGQYFIVPDICISSKGLVNSVLLYSKTEFSNIKTIALDTNSRTSATLIRILMSNVFGIKPIYYQSSPNLQAMLENYDAGLIIGDKALYYQPENLNILDLGESWFRLTGLPFVYAFWAGWPGVIDRKGIKILHQSLDLGLKNIRVIAEEFALQGNGTPKINSDYLMTNIRFKLGPEELEGLKLFYKYAHEFGQIAILPEIKFYDA